MNELMAGAIGILTAVGGGIGFLLNHLSTQKKSQREHDLQIEAARREHEERLVSRYETLSTRHDQVVTALQSESRTEFRSLFNTLLSVQRDTTSAISNLTDRVGDLGKAIEDIRGELAARA